MNNTSLNRHLAVRTGNETVFIFNGRDAEKYGEAPAVLWRYAQAMINGDADAYNALFSEKYLSEHDAQKDFPMQRVYDFSATCYSEHTFTDEELDGQYEGVTQYRYEVLYSIQYNDGSVRGDMGSGVLKPIYMEILIDKKEETAKINRYFLREIAFRAVGKPEREDRRGILDFRRRGCKWKHGCPGSGAA